MELDPAEDMDQALYVEYFVPEGITAEEVTAALGERDARLWQWIKDQPGPVTEADVELAILAGKLEW